MTGQVAAVQRLMSRMVPGRCDKEGSAPPAGFRMRVPVACGLAADRRIVALTDGVPAHPETVHQFDDLMLEAFVCLTHQDELCKKAAETLLDIGVEMRCRRSHRDQTFPQDRSCHNASLTFHRLPGFL